MYFAGNLVSFLAVKKWKYFNNWQSRIPSQCAALLFGPPLRPICRRPTLQAWKKLNIRYNRLCYYLVFTILFLYRRRTKLSLALCRPSYLFRYYHLDGPKSRGAVRRENKVRLSDAAPGTGRGSSSPAAEILPLCSCLIMQTYTRDRSKFGFGFGFGAERMHSVVFR